MRVTLLPSAVAAGNGVACQYATTFLVNDSVAVDAGCLGFYGEPEAQARVRHVLLSHSHIDHIASLPIFVENVYAAGERCVTIYGSRAVLDSLQQDVFNNRLWPDFVALSPPGAMAPFLRLESLHSGQPLDVAGLQVRPVNVDHTVPTQGFVIADDHSAIVITSDTGPTEALWAAARSTPNLKAVFIEVTFPNGLASLAQLSLHLTPAMLAEEVRKMPAGVPVHVMHLKARFRDIIHDELCALGLPNLHIAAFGTPYEF